MWNLSYPNAVYSGEVMASDEWHGAKMPQQLLVSHKCGVQ